MAWASQVALVVKNLPASAGDLGLMPVVRRSPGVGNGKALQYSFLENPMDGGVSRAPIHRVAKSQTQLSIHSLLYLNDLVVFPTFFN